MSYAKSQTELLAARDAREALLGSLREFAGTPLIFLSTAIPGVEKSPPGSDALFLWGRRQLGLRLPHCRHLVTRIDRLGWCAVFAVEGTPAEVKRTCMTIEDSHTSARLLDLDVYTANGVQLGRTQIGAPVRRCLLCDQPASDCIRLRRHSIQALQAHVNDLLRQPL